MTREDARALATRTFGNVTAAQERFHESRRILWLDHLGQDLRYALRQLGKAPGFAAVAVATLALGIGANTAIFSVVKAVLLEPLPYHEPDRLVHVVQHIPADQSIDGRPRESTALDLNELLELRNRTQALSRIAAYDTPLEMTLGGREEPIRVVGTPISADLLPTLGVQPLMGRRVAAFEEKPESAQSVILGYPLWHSHFASDPDILGRTVTLNGRQYSVAGVMPRGFEFPDRSTQFWFPINLAPPVAGEIRGAIPVARIHEDVSLEAAASEVIAIIGNVRASYPSERLSPPARLIELVTLQDRLVRPVRPALVVLSAAVGFVLLIACSNVASLLLARGAARRGEHAIRSALGAGRGRLMRQTLTESCVLAVMGGATGCVLAVAGVRLLGSLAPTTIPRLDTASVDADALTFTLAISLVTGLFFGLIPALQFSRAPHMEAIQGDAARTTVRLRARSAIVVLQIAAAVMLLIGSGLVIVSFVKLANVDPGFDPNNVLVFQAALPQPTNANMLTDGITQQFLDRLGALPGVEAAAFTNAAPLVPGAGFSQPRIEGASIPMKGIPEFREVSRDYIAAMRLRLLDGRWFTDADEAGRVRVAVINEAMARYFGNDSPIGKTLTLARDSAEIVGIVDNIHDQALSAEPRPQVYIDVRQSLRRTTNAQALNWAYFIVRADRDPISLVPDIRGILQQMIPGATLKLNVASMEQIISKSVAQPRFNAFVLGTFGGMAALLAMIGVYGVTAYWVAQRTREIGVRVALGAHPRRVLVLALRQSVVLAMIGITCGLGGAVALTRYLDSLLFGLTPLDTATFLVVSAGFALTVALASYIPARRAARIDPCAALRHE